jgi:Protein of unknown function (DUF3370)
MNKLQNVLYQGGNKMSIKVNPITTGHINSVAKTSVKADKPVKTTATVNKQPVEKIVPSNKNPSEAVAARTGINNAELKKSELIASKPIPNAVKVDSKASVSVEDALPAKKLKPVQGSFSAKSADLFIVDNPETFSSSGVLGSTMGAVKGRNPSGNAPNKYTFTDSARSYTLANNGTGKPQRFQVAVKNESNHPIKITATGVQYMKGSKNTLGIPENYSNNPPKGQEFRGPQAVAAQSYLNAQPGQNGYKTITKTLQPGETAVLSDLYQSPGAEVFSLLDIKASRANSPNMLEKAGEKLFGESKNQFSLAVAATEKSLTAKELKDFGNLPAAGIANRKDGKSDFAGISSPEFLGRPNGVVKNGSTFTGSSVIEVGDGTTKGQLVLATKNKNAGSKAEIGQISNVLPNPTTDKPVTIPGVAKPLPLGNAAPANEGNYGASYDLNYTLKNSSDKPKTVQVLLTSPSTGKPHNPDGGEFTHPIKVNGKNVQLRVDHAGEGRVVATVTVPPRSDINLPISFTNFGNTYPPVGIEFRPNN